LQKKLFKNISSPWIEVYFRRSGYKIIAGIDEAGRGAIAGPVFAACVILPFDFFSEEIKDSKKLSPKKREELFQKICNIALDYTIAKSDVDEINSEGIFKATFKAMLRAIKGLKIKPDLILVDGPYAIPEYKGIQKAIVKGDSTSISISAASILAKVSRDKYMKELDKKYPQYAFSKHKGYATDLHFKLIKKYGLSPVHRSYYKCFKNNV